METVSISGIMRQGQKKERLKMSKKLLIDLLHKLKFYSCGSTDYWLGAFDAIVQIFRDHHFIVVETDNYFALEDCHGREVVRV